MIVIFWHVCYNVQLCLGKGLRQAIFSLIFWREKIIFHMELLIFCKICDLKLKIFATSAFYRFKKRTYVTFIRVHIVLTPF